MLLILLGNSKVIFSRDGMDKTKLGTGKKKDEKYTGTMKVDSVCWENDDVTTDFAIVILNGYPKEGIKIEVSSGGKYTIKHTEPGTAHYRVFWAESGDWREYSVEIEYIPNEGTVQYTLYTFKKHNAIVDFGWLSKEGKYYMGEEKRETASTDRQAFIGYFQGNKDIADIMVRLPEKFDGSAGPLFIQNIPLEKAMKCSATYNVIGAVKNKFNSCLKGASTHGYFPGSEILKWVKDNKGSWGLNYKPYEFATVFNVYDFEKEKELAYKEDEKYDGLKEGTYVKGTEFYRRLVFAIPKTDSSQVNQTKSNTQNSSKTVTGSDTSDSIEEVLNKKLEKGEIVRWGYMGKDGDWYDQTTDPTVSPWASSDGTLAFTKYVSGKDRIFIELDDNVFVSRETSSEMMNPQDAKKEAEKNGCRIITRAEYDKMYERSGEDGWNDGYYGIDIAMNEFALLGDEVKFMNTYGTDYTEETAYSTSSAYFHYAIDIK